ncbi:MAG TPA: sigma-70 factor domain-containing protein [Acidimicrobiales bacterium]|nr:sigma-70 factor domain-containing protein [Acidimicrobiales bacterium]
MKERSAGDQDLVRTYLDGIGRYPLLTKEDEVNLARRIERGRDAERELRSGVAMDSARSRELKRASRDGREATEEFIKANLRLVVSVAKKYQSAEMPLLDLIQEGNLGLIFDRSAPGGALHRSGRWLVACRSSTWLRLATGMTSRQMVEM